jgi:hypothetical protein
LPATQYTVLIGAVADTPQVTLRDQNQPAPSGQVALRFVDQAARTGAVDIYLVPPHQTLADLKPIVTNVAPGGNTGYLDLPIGTYTVVVLPAGTVPTHDAVPLYTGAQIAYADGSARTMILIDQLQIRGYHLQLITADDFDSPGPG